MWRSRPQGKCPPLVTALHLIINSYVAEPVTGDNHLGAESRPQEQYFGSGSPHYVMGPMVVRVFPDGRPVPGDSATAVPRDEDAEEHQAMRVKPVPSMLDLLHGHHQQQTTATPQ